MGKHPLAKKKMSIFGDLIKETMRGYFFYQNIYSYKFGRI